MLKLTRCWRASGFLEFWPRSLARALDRDHTFFQGMRMTDLSAQLQKRVSDLEHQFRRVYGLAILVCVASFALVTTAFLRAPRTSDVLRTRQLIIEDVAGRDRIVLGAPVRDNFNRISPATGMVIRDSSGSERFGVSLDARGNVGLGLDAPRCTSDPCNRERINLVADANGGSHLRLLDRQTGVAARIVLDDDDRAYLDFMKVTRDSIQQHRLGLRVDTTFSGSRH